MSPVYPHIVNCITEGQEVPTNTNDTMYKCDLPVSFDEDVGDLIGSITNIGCLTGALFTGVLLGWVGRKWTMILLNVPFVIGWVCLLIPGWADMDTPALFYVGRVLTGIGTLVLIKEHWEFFTLIIDDYFAGAGGFALAAPMYTGEITETSIRGAMGSVMQFMLVIGISFVFALDIENAVNWQIITGLCIIFPSKSNFMAPFYTTRGVNIAITFSSFFLLGKKK